MRICTLESSLFPLSAVVVILHLSLTAPLLIQHTVHVKGPRKHNICQCTNLHNEHQRKKDIYTPQNGLVFNKHFTSHENTVKNNVCANLPLSCWIISSMILIQFEIVFWFKYTWLQWLLSLVCLIQWKETSLLCESQRVRGNERHSFRSLTLCFLYLDGTQIVM